MKLQYLRETLLVSYDSSKRTKTRTADIGTWMPAVPGSRAFGLSDHDLKGKDGDNYSLGSSNFIQMKQAPVIHPSDGSPGLTPSVFCERLSYYACICH